MGQFYYKIQQLLEIAIILLQIVTVQSLAAFNLFHMFTQSIKFYTCHCHIKGDSSNTLSAQT